MILLKRKDNTEMIRTDVVKLSPEGKEKYKNIVYEELWLRYFNDTLLKQQIITEDEHIRMFQKILERTAKLSKGIQ